MSPQQPQRQPQTPWPRLAGMGFEFGASLAVFTLLGWWVDRHWATAPWGLLIGVLLGLIGGTYNFVREAMAAIRETNRQSGRGRQTTDKASDRPPEDGPTGGAGDKPDGTE